MLGSLTAGEAQAGVDVVVAAAELAVLLAVVAHLVHAALVVVEVFQEPNRRPPVLLEIVLIIRVQRLQRLQRHFADDVVVDAEVRHAPVRQLVGVVQLQSAERELLSPSNDSN